jgi:asparagine synthase (glutamine-hydrolysing)
MCGIIGATGYCISEQALRAAVYSMRHRGPDGSGVFMDPESLVALGHARLPIIDRSPVRNFTLQSGYAALMWIQDS